LGTLAILKIMTSIKANLKVWKLFSHKKKRKKEKERNISFENFSQLNSEYRWHSLRIVYSYVYIPRELVFKTWLKTNKNQ
jgi:hypothetical protein